MVNKAHSGSTHIVCRNAPIDGVNYTVTFRGGGGGGGGAFLIAVKSVSFC